MIQSHQNGGGHRAPYWLSKSQSHVEKVKKDMESGDMMMWGISVGGGCGFAVAKEDPKKAFADSLFFSPYVKAEVRPMLTVDEMVEVMQGMQK